MDKLSVDSRKHWKTTYAYHFVDNDYVYVITSMGSKDAEDGDGKNAGLITAYNKEGDTHVKVMLPEHFKHLIDDLKSKKIIVEAS